MEYSESDIAQAEAEAPEYEEAIDATPEWEVAVNEAFDAVLDKVRVHCDAGGEEPYTVVAFIITKDEHMFSVDSTNLPCKSEAALDIAAAMKQLASDYLSRAVAARNSESIEFEKAIAQLRK